MSFDIINFNKSIQNVSDVKLFFGDYDGIQRYDRYKYPIMKKLYDIQEANRWSFNEINFGRDKATIGSMPEGHQEIYRANLLFQTLADSLANRFLEDVLSEHITSPELESVIKTQGNFELLHSNSYSFNIRQVYSDPEEFFNQGFLNKDIQSRLLLEQKCYQELKGTLDGDSDLDTKKKALMEAMIRQYALESLRFFISFLYTFQINELNGQNLQGSVNNIVLIANDELIHTNIFKHIIKILKDNPDEGFTELFESGFVRETMEKVFDEVIESEMQWYSYLDSIEEIQGMTEENVLQFLQYYANRSMAGVGFKDIKYREKENELVTFFENKKNINGQKALAQETNLLSYSVGQVSDGGFDEANYSEFLKEV